jgi:hypothetical protein
MLRLSVAALAALTLSACANVCDRAANNETVILNKTKNCAVFQDNFKSTFNKDTCNKEVAQCTADDTQKINAMLDCMEKLPDCTEATLDTWATELAACSEKATGLSQACTGALAD